MTPPLIDRIARGMTTVSDAERVLAVFKAAQNIVIDANGEIDWDDIENLVEALQAAQE